MTDRKEEAGPQEKPVLGAKILFSFTTMPPSMLRARQGWVTPWEEGCWGGVLGSKASSGLGMARRGDSLGRWTQG